MSVDTKTTGAVLFTTKMNIAGYTIRMRMEGETLDVIKVVLPDRVANELAAQARSSAMQLPPSTTRH